MAKVSVIVPIYNVEKYIRRSIESIQNQTLKDIEIILVNDGSPDNCLSICKDYAGCDHRIQIISKPNGGAASARNAGIKVAVGEYIGFVDPDDWIEPDMYEKMYKKISETGSDMCMCDYVIQNKGKTQSVILGIEDDMLNRKKIVEEIIPEIVGASDLNSNSLPIMAAVWRLLISKKLIDDYNISFSENMKMMDDLIYYIKLLLHTQKITIDRGQYYHYMTNPESIVNRYREDLIEIRDTILKKMNDLLQNGDNNELIKRRLDIRYANMCITTIVNTLHKDNRAKRSKKIEMIKLICSDEKLKQILNYTDTKGYTVRKKLVLYSIKNEIALYLFLYYSLIIKLI